MPSDAADVVPTEGSNDGPRPPVADPEHQAHVDEENVPHPGDAHEH